MNTLDTIDAIFLESNEVMHLLRDQAAVISDISSVLIRALSNGNKILLCGNGGSAADAQHVAAEFVGRFLKERAAWPAIALTTNTSILSALGNDYSFEIVFSRQVEALANPDDVVVGISTSGNSPDVLNAMVRAKARGCVTIGFTGSTGGKLKDSVDVCLRVPSNSTPRVQEAHILVWHIVCELVELALTANERVVA